MTTQGGKKDMLMPVIIESHLFGFRGQNGMAYSPNLAKDGHGQTMFRKKNS